MNIFVKGNVLLLIGPIGNFFTRLASYFIKKNIIVHKIDFPIKEIFFAKGAHRHKFNEKAEAFSNYLDEFIKTHKIEQIYMSADFYNVHQMAIQIANQHNIPAYVFELGYIRPHYVSLEQNCVNARSNLNKPVEFYHALPYEAHYKTPQHKASARPWRKIFMPFCFLLQTLSRYEIIPYPHKSQPKFRYIGNQLLGSIRKGLYWFTEKSIQRKISKLHSLFLVPLQVDTDSQIMISSKYNGMKPFIEEVLTSFAHHATKESNLVFKHHPADRGYNNYKKYIKELATRLQCEERVFYIHDMGFGQLFPRCKGAITVNSSVGINALKALIPTKVMGDTFYDMEGLTFQKDLDDFWQQPYRINKQLLKKFYNHMIESTQINGDFHAYFPFDEIFSFQEEEHPLKAINEVTAVSG